MGMFRRSRDAVEQHPLGIAQSLLRLFKIAPGYGMLTGNVSHRLAGALAFSALGAKITNQVV
jgi:hypothetical protein